MRQRVLAFVPVPRSCATPPPMSENHEPESTDTKPTDEQNSAPFWLLVAFGTVLTGLIVYAALGR